MTACISYVSMFPSLVETVVVASMIVMKVQHTKIKKSTNFHDDIKFVAYQSIIVKSFKLFEAAARKDLNRTCSLKF